MTELAIVAAAVLAAAEPSVVIDQVVAVVDRTVITESELIVEARVALVRRERGRGVAFLEQGIDAPLRRSVLQYLINQILIAQAVRRLGLDEVTDEEMTQALSRFRQEFPSGKAYDAFIESSAISEDTLRALLHREIVTERYIKQRMQTWVAGVDGREADARGRAALQQWVEDLRSQVEISILGPDGVLEKL